MSIHAALLALAQEITNPAKTEVNPGFKNAKFAPLPDILTKMRPLLAKHGLVMVQSSDVDAHGAVIVTTIYFAKDGTSISGRYPLEPGKKDAQGYAGAMTYGRRYALMGMLGIAGDDDDDGEAASRQPSAAKADKIDKVTQISRTKACERTTEQKAEAGTLNMQTLQYAGDAHREAAEQDTRACWKEWAYTESWPDVVKALTAVRSKYYAIAINEKRA